MKLKGIYAPIPTPFREEKIAFHDLAANLSRWEKTPLHGLVVSGSNGESVLLDEEEKVKLTAFVRESYPSDRPVVAGTGAESTAASVRLTKQCAGAGADAALVINPSYFKGSLSTAALKDFYNTVAERSPVPVIIYNMPRNTGLNLSADLVIELSGHPNIIGIKDSSGDIVQIANIIARSTDDFSVFAGSGSFLLPSLCLGATGGTLAVANLLPETCVQILDLYTRGALEEARTLQMKILQVNSAVTSRWGVAGLKAALDMLGYYGGPPRRPLPPLSEEEKGQLRIILEEAGAI